MLRSPAFAFAPPLSALRPAALQKSRPLAGPTAAPLFRARPAGSFCARPGSASLTPLFKFAPPAENASSESLWPSPRA